MNVDDGAWRYVTCMSASSRCTTGRQCGFLGQPAANIRHPHGPLLHDLPPGVLVDDLAVAEGVVVAASHIHRDSVGRSARERPLRDSKRVATRPVARLTIVNIGNARESTG